MLQCEIKVHALALATHHVQFAPTALEPWLQLARAYVLQGSYGLALAALNAAPLQAHRAWASASRGGGFSLGLGFGFGLAPALLLLIGV